MPTIEHNDEACHFAVPLEIWEFIIDCHWGEYNAIRYTLLAVGLILGLLSAINVSLIVSQLGLKNLNQNIRTTQHWVCSLLCTIGLFSFCVSCGNIFLIDPDNNRVLSAVFGTIASVMVNQILVIHFYYWYTIGLALVASVTLRPVAADKKVLQRIKIVLAILMIMVWLASIITSVIFSLHLEDTISISFRYVQIGSTSLFIILTSISTCITFVLGVRIYMLFGDVKLHMSAAHTELGGRDERTISAWQRANDTASRIVWMSALLTVLGVLLLIPALVTVAQPLTNYESITWHQIVFRLLVPWVLILMVYAWLLINLRFNRDDAYSINSSWVNKVVARWRQATTDNAIIHVSDSELDPHSSSDNDASQPHIHPTEDKSGHLVHNESVETVMSHHSIHVTSSSSHSNAA